MECDSAALEKEDVDLVKLILIFPDGTGQVGGLRPDQRLSNVYKMYRAMRPDPDSPSGRTSKSPFTIPA